MTSTRASCSDCRTSLIQSTTRHRERLDTRRVLIIEDDSDIARFVEVNLTHNGFDVAIEYDGDAGLARIQQDDFDVVVCNYMMPGLLGDEVVQRLRVDPRTRKLPVVMLTGQAGASHVARAMEAGADDYVTKPFDPLEFVARVRAAIRRRTSNKLVDRPTTSCSSSRGCGQAPRGAKPRSSLDHEQHVVRSSFLRSSFFRCADGLPPAR